MYEYMQTISLHIFTLISISSHQKTTTLKDPSAHFLWWLLRVSEATFIVYTY